MNNVRYILASLTLLLASLSVMSAQTDRREVRQGNRQFRKGEFQEAQISYMKALTKDSLSFAANYNLAGADFELGDYDKAVEALKRVEQQAVASPDGAAYYYNLGRVAIAKQDWKTAVDAFAKSLLMKPGDLDAKENYIYARKKLEDQQNQQNQNNDQNNDQNQDQNQDQNDDQNDDKKNDQNDDQNQNGDNDQDQNQNQNDQNDDQQQNQQGQQPKITPQAAQQMLQAIQAKEKETQDKVNKAKALEAKTRQKEKNW